MAATGEKSSKKRKFNILSDSDVAEKKKKLDNENTVKQEKRANTAFTLFLQAAGEEDLEYWDFTFDKLDNYLGKFFLGVEKEEGQKYKLTSLQGFRYALNRILKKKGKKVDIIHDSAFTNSQKCYAAACLELKEEGLGAIDSAPEINEDGMHDFFTKSSKNNFTNRYQVRSAEHDNSKEKRHFLQKLLVEHVIFFYYVVALPPIYTIYKVSQNPSARSMHNSYFQTEQRCTTLCTWTHTTTDIRCKIRSSLIYVSTSVDEAARTCTH